MAFTVSFVNRSGAQHLLCKSSHGHFYLGGQQIYGHVFQTKDEYDTFIATLKNLTVDDDCSKYDLDVFSLIDNNVAFEEIPVKKKETHTRITR